MTALNIRDNCWSYRRRPRVQFTKVLKALESAEFFCFIRMTTQAGGRTFVVLQKGSLESWNTYTRSKGPISVAEAEGKPYMAIVYPKRAADLHRNTIQAPMGFTQTHISDSVNIRDFVESRGGMMANYGDSKSRKSQANTSQFEDGYSHLNHFDIRRFRG